jgi:hypothetical protein
MLFMAAQRAGEVTILERVLGPELGAIYRKNGRRAR